MSRGEKMEFTIQKSVELGVNTITPLLSERCGVRLDPERLEKNDNNGKRLPLLRVSSVVVIGSHKFVLYSHSKHGVLRKMGHLRSTYTHEQHKVSIHYLPN